MELPQFFTFSMTEVEDSLDQWRGYCPKGGCCISFEREQFNKFIKNNKLKLAEIQYVEEFTKEFDDEISNVVGSHPDEERERLKSQFPAYTKNLENKLHSLSYQAADLHGHAPFFKHNAFSGEKEWRLVFNEVINYKNLDFRDGINTLLPYIKLPLVENKDEEDVKIHRVIIGPTSRPELSENAFKMRLKGNSTITNSKIPYYWL
jgi:hypothetical protein